MVKALGSDPSLLRFESLRRSLSGRVLTARNRFWKPANEGSSPFVPTLAQYGSLVILPHSECGIRGFKSHLRYSRTIAQSAEREALTLGQFQFESE